MSINAFCYEDSLIINARDKLIAELRAENSSLKKLLQANGIEYRTAAQMMNDAGIPNVLSGRGITIKIPQ